MSEHTQKPQPPGNQYGQGHPGQYPTPQPPTGQYQTPQPPAGQYPPGQPPPSQYPPGQPPPGQYPPAQPPYPPQYQPPTPPPEQSYPPGQPPPGQYPTPKPPVDPCEPEWGPPEISAECCPPDHACCGGGETPGPCAWDEVDDPCVRAASADCGYEWTKLSCKCESSNTACTCDEWDCGGFPDGMCVPCKPCEGLIPEGEDPGGSGCEDTPGDDCNAESLRRQLEANQRCISSRQAEKVKLDAEITARQDRDKALAALIASFDTIVEKYKTERYKLICREDCLKGFARDTIKTLQDSFQGDCLGAMEAAINAELCRLEKIKCCQKNLEWKLERSTRLIWEQKEAEKAWKKADEAFGFIKDLPKWMGDQFTELEKLKDQIAQALNEKDPLKHRWAFYLFYWKFIPRLCKRFPVAVCCEPTPTTPPATPPTGYAAPPPEGAAPAAHIGCKPGDWHPKKIDIDLLKKLICCAWETVRAKKQALEDQTAAVEAAKHNLAFIKKQAEDNAKALEDRIKTQIESVVCGAASSR